MLNEQYNRIKYLMGYDTSKPLTEQAKILNTLLLTESVNFGTFLKGPIQVMIREWVGGLMGAFEKEVIEKMAKELGSSEAVIRNSLRKAAGDATLNPMDIKVVFTFARTAGPRTAGLKGFERGAREAFNDINQVFKTGNMNVAMKEALEVLENTLGKENMNWMAGGSGKWNGHPMKKMLDEFRQKKINTDQKVDVDDGGGNVKPDVDGKVKTDVDGKTVYKPSQRKPKDVFEEETGLKWNETLSSSAEGVKNKGGYNNLNTSLNKESAKVSQVAGSGKLWDIFKHSPGNQGLTKGEVKTITNGTKGSNNYLKQVMEEGFPPTKAPYEGYTGPLRQWNESTNSWAKPEYSSSDIVNMLSRRWQQKQISSNSFIQSMKNKWTKTISNFKNASIGGKFRQIVDTALLVFNTAMLKTNPITKVIMYGLTWGAFRGLNKKITSLNIKIRARYVIAGFNVMSLAGALDGFDNLLTNIKALLDDIPGKRKVAFTENLYLNVLTPDFYSKLVGQKSEMESIVGTPEEHAAVAKQIAEIIYNGSLNGVTFLTENGFTLKDIGERIGNQWPTNCTVAFASGVAHQFKREWQRLDGEEREMYDVFEQVQKLEWWKGQSSEYDKQLLTKLGAIDFPSWDDLAPTIKDWDLIGTDVDEILVTAQNAYQTGDITQQLENELKKIAENEKVQMTADYIQIYETLIRDYYGMSLEQSDVTEDEFIQRKTNQQQAIFKLREFLFGPYINFGFPLKSEETPYMLFLPATWQTISQGKGGKELQTDALDKNIQVTRVTDKPDKITLGLRLSASAKVNKMDHLQRINDAKNKFIGGESYYDNLPSKIQGYILPELKKETGLDNPLLYLMAALESTSREKRNPRNKIQFEKRRGYIITPNPVIPTQVEESKIIGLAKLLQ